MAQTKKIIGLSCGRPKGNSEILLKEALMAAEELGMESEIIRAMELTVKPCKGCEACTLTISRGGKPKCAIKGDDGDWLLDKILVEDCALIVAVPSYFYRASGLFNVICDRSLVTNVQHPEIRQKTRVGGIISLGGGEPGWTPLALTEMNIFMQQTRVLVDQMQVNYCARPGTVLMEDRYMKRARQLGQNMAKALMMPIEKVKYVGEEPENCCPSCRGDVLQVWEALPEVICPVCLLHGTVKSDAGKIKVQWDKKWRDNYRFSEKSMLDHFEFIGKLAKKYHTEDEPTAKERNKKYLAWGNMVKPPAADR
jgi:multimeric flavodoxin WrbA